MYKVGHLCVVDVLPPLAKAIYNGDVSAVKKFPKKELEASIPLASHTSVYPLELSILLNQEGIIGYLLDEKIMPPYQNLKESVRYLSGAVLDRLLKVYNVDVFDDKFKTELIASVGYNSNFSAIPSLEKHGITVEKYGGEALISACILKGPKEAEQWLRRGADVNFHSRDARDTPLHIAVMFKSMDLARLLVEQHHADVTVQNNLGFRPYTCAAFGASAEFMEYLRPREPAELHDVEQIGRELDQYSFPHTLRDFLSTPAPSPSLSEAGNANPTAQLHRRCLLVPLDGMARFTTSVSLPDESSGKESDEEDEYVEKPPNMKTFFAFGAEKECSDNLLVFCVDTKKVGFFDVEHNIYYEMTEWDSFVSDPATYMDKMYA